MIARLKTRRPIAVAPAAAALEPSAPAEAGAAAGAAAGAGEPRFEIKTVCERMGLEQILAELRLRGAAFRKLHPRRIVQSVYLDTPFGRAVEENLAGISRREKIRFRWYGEAARRVMGTLERKTRENRLGWKGTLRLTEPMDVEGVGRLSFVRALARVSTPAWREALNGLEPAQWIAYERDYLVTGDGTIRMTIDRDLRFFDQRCGAVLSRRRASPAPQLMVIECKAPASREDQLHELLGGFPLVVDKCSKFAMASGAGGPIVSMLPI